jgi:hypothetical protein
MRHKTIQPGKKKGGPCVSDLKEIFDWPNGTIHVKLNFNSDFNLLSQQLKNVLLPVEYPKLYNEPLKITQQKFQDLEDF